MLRGMARVDDESMEVIEGVGEGEGPGALAPMLIEFGFRSCAAGGVLVGLFSIL